MDSDAIAVVVISHQYGRYLPDALDSVMIQSYAPQEIVVMDDASTDDTRDVTERYFDRGVQYARIEALNQHEGRREGYRLTASPLLCFLDADDMLDRNYLSEAAAVLSDPSVAVAFSDTYKFDDDRPAITRRHHHRLGRIERGNFIHAGAVVRRSALTQSRVMEYPLPNANQRYSDWWLWRHALHGGGKAVWSPGRYLYRMHTGSVSSKMATPNEYRYCKDLTPCWDRKSE